jgi:RNA polymerase II subunit A small phosphatase-like protein
MVSKISKRTPTKSIKDCRKSNHQHRRRHRRKSPAKNVIASINKSLFACHRRLVKLFSKLARIATPSPNRHNKGYKILHKFPELELPESETSVRKALVFDNIEPARLPPLIAPKRTVVLDLDETLVHSKMDPPPDRFDFLVRPRIDGEIMNFYVQKRPGVEDLLAALGERFEVVVFTAGRREYASLVLDRLDRKGVVAHALYRDACKEIDGKYVKDLSGLGRDLRRVLIVDDNPNAYGLQPENAIPIVPFTGDLGDRELGRLMEFLDGCDGVEDMREAVKLYVGADQDAKKTL